VSSNPTALAVDHHCGHRASGGASTTVVDVVVDDDVVVSVLAFPITVELGVGVFNALTGNAIITITTINAPMMFRNLIIA
jgi:hypothetical protein